LQVDRNGDIPVGTQLAWQIQALITQSRLLPGEQLPSVRRLADAAGVNVNTIRSVYERLEGEGFIRTEHGRGSFVADNVTRLDPHGDRRRTAASRAGRARGSGEARGAAPSPPGDELTQRFANTYCIGNGCTPSDSASAVPCRETIGISISSASSQVANASE